MGLFEEIEQRKNVYHYKKLTEDDFKELISQVETEEINYDPIMAQTMGIAYQMGVKDAEERERIQQRINSDMLLIQSAYTKVRLGMMTMERADNISKMIQSKDDEARRMAIKILEGL